MIHLRLIYSFLLIMIFLAPFNSEAGESAGKEIKVTQKQTGLSQLPAEIISKRMRLAVYPFEHKGPSSENAAYFDDLLALAFQEQERFQLVDRTILTRILEEQKLGRSGLVDKNSAVRIGKMMSAEAIITGTISGTERGIEIVARMIDTETSQILITEKTFSDKEGLSSMKNLSGLIVNSFISDLPMNQGIVIKRKDGHIYIDLGQERIPLHGRIIIYRDTGPGGKESKILGHARVTQVFRDMSKAELIEGRLDEINVLDRVIIQ